MAETGARLFGGIAMAVASGAVTALSMVIQRGALAHSSRTMRVALCGREIGELNAHVVWALGLVLYGIGTGVLYSFAGLWIPLSLLSCLFLTLLVFNLAFSKYLLHEQLTRPRVLGSAVVLVGACLCAIGTSVGQPGVPTEYTPDDVAALFAAPAGAIWFSLLVLSVLLTLGMILAFERRYPLGESASRPPPAALERAMAIIYPASLGLDEAIAHLGLRCMNAMLASGCESGGCANPVFGIVIVLWVVSSVATVVWLRIVFKRFDVTSALPVEYGAASAADVVSGLLFFREADYYEGWRYALIVGGVVLCLAGIGRMHGGGAQADDGQAPAPVAERKLEEHAGTAQLQAAAHTSGRGGAGLVVPELQATPLSTAELAAQELARTASAGSAPGDSRAPRPQSPQRARPNMMSETDSD
jgi:hypothetical protein